MIIRIREVKAPWLVAAAFLAGSTIKTTITAQSISSHIGERPAIEGHLNETGIERGAIKFKQLLEIGEEIFAARWNKLDG